VPPPTVDRARVIAHRFARHQLDREASSAAATDVDVLDIGVQDTGTDGSSWALEVRGARPASEDDLFLAWTIRGAPHAYRRTDVAAITIATAPYSEADAASRIHDASRPFRQHDIAVLDALTTIAREMRDIARRPVTKGDMSTELTRRLADPYLRSCQPCNAIHTYEQPFRLAALQAGLELESGTSPPVLRRIPHRRPSPYRHLAGEADDRFDVVRGYLRSSGPASVKAIATFLDAPVAEITARLPEDVVAVRIGGTSSGDVEHWVLEEDVAALRTRARRSTGVVRLVGSHDPYLQLRDREVLVADGARRKDLWRTLGRPGAVLLDGEVAGTWRPRASGKALTVLVEPWGRMTGATKTAVRLEAERLAAHRSVELAGVDGL
jgi:hypothetical protein